MTQAHLARPYPLAPHAAARPDEAARRTARTGVSSFELAFLALSGFIFATQVLQVILRTGSDAEAGNVSPAAARIFAGVYALLVVLLIGRRKAVIRAARHAPLFVLLTAFPLMTLLWGVSRSQSLSPAIAVTGTSLLGLYLATRFDMRQLIVVLGLVYSLAGVISTMLAIAVPSMGVMSSAAWAGAWAGLYVHKNSLGAAMSVGALVLIYGIALTRGPMRLWFFAALAATLLALVMSRSATALLNVALLLAVLGWARMAQKWPGRTLPLTVAGFGLLALGFLQMLVFSGLDPLFNLLGRNADISGRLPLWEITLQYISQRPALGFGYEAFWVPFSSQVEFVSSVVHYSPFYSHNGALETLLNGGIVLLGLVLAAYAVSVARALRFLLAGERPFHASFPLVFYVFFLVANITESRILFRNDLIWSLFVAIGVLLAVELRRVRQRERAGWSARP